MIKLSVSLVLFVRDPLLLCICISFSFSRPRFRGQKSALCEEIVRSERRPPNERESPPRLLLSDSVANSPLFPATAVFLHHLVFFFLFLFFFFFSTTTATATSSYGDDGGFQRDVLAAANSMRDESSTVTDTAGQRSIAGG